MDWKNRKIENLTFNFFYLKKKFLNKPKLLEKRETATVKLTLY